MAERIVLVLSGGGALGAYQGGVYRALVRHLDAETLRSMIIVGASSGAISGFVIAAHSRDPDHGVGALERFWRSVAVPSLPFIPSLDAYSQRLNATLTGLTFGNPSMIVGLPGGMLGGLFTYPYLAGFSNAVLMGSVSAHAESYAAASVRGPRLMVRAVDIAKADTVWFDSDEETIVPSMIGASSAIPLLCQPVWHEGRAYWDGDVWHQGILPSALRRFRQENRDENYHAIVVELFKRTPQEQHHMGLGVYLDHFRRMFLGARHDEDVANLPDTVRVTRIQREPHEQERASTSLLDWAPGRIDQLIEQGEADAERMLGGAGERATAQ